MTGGTTVQQPERRRAVSAPVYHWCAVFFLPALGTESFHLLPAAPANQADRCLATFLRRARLAGRRTTPLSPVRSIAHTARRPAFAAPLLCTATLDARQTAPLTQATPYRAHLQTPPQWCP